MTILSDIAEEINSNPGEIYRLKEGWLFWVDNDSGSMSDIMPGDLLVALEARCDYDHIYEFIFLYGEERIRCNIDDFDSLTVYFATSVLEKLT